MANKALDRIKDSLSHEAVNVYAEAGIFLPYPTPTWWLISEDALEGKNLYELAPTLLDALYNTLGLSVNIFGPDETRTVWKAKYEVIQLGEEFTYPDAKIGTSETIAILVDFIGGLPYGCAEIMNCFFEGQLTSTEVVAQDGMVPPVPTRFFAGLGEEPIYNLLWLAQDANAVMLKKSMEDEDEEMQLHWWIRHNYDYKTSDGTVKRYPIPGTFIGLIARFFPNLPTGRQRSSPFLVSGNFLDTTYYTRARITEVLEPTETRYFKLYRVAWRKNSSTDDTDIFLARPSGFEEYEVGQYVAIEKDCETTRTSQTWADDQEWQETKWRIVPYTFYMIQE